MSPRWIWSDKITNERVARVCYNHFQTPRNNKSTRPAASCFHYFLGIWNPWWNTRTRFWYITSYPTRAKGIIVLVNSQTGFCRRFLFPQFYKASEKRIQLPVTRAPTPAITWLLHNKKLNESDSYANDNLSSTCGENQARIIQPVKYKVNRRFWKFSSVK